jgi:uncharacterized coiled-coil protein SlyX
MKTENENNSIDFIETLITSFEDRIQKIEKTFSSSESLIESSQALLNDFQYSLKKLKKERNILNNKLRENLAKIGSLRKNDYDGMMGELFFVLEQKEKEAEDEFHQYLEYQKTMASLLREGVLEIKNIGQNDNKGNIKNFKIEIKTILKAQQEKKEEATIKFLELQDIHEKISNSFNGLINQDTHVFCKDLKNVKKYLLEEIK